jgi:hypothetical protein
MNSGKTGVPVQVRRSHFGPRWPLSAAVLCLQFGLAACDAGNGEGLDVSGRPIAEGGDVPLAATLKSIQVNVFDATCTICHAGAAAPLGLRLDAANSFTSLVGVDSREDSSLLRVAPGNPDASYLVRKLEGTAAEGERMPLGGPPIPDATIAFVRQWIADGALPEEPAIPGAAAVIISLSPAPDSITADFPPEITVGFDQEIDASTLNAATVALERSGGDRVFDNGNDIAVLPATIQLTATNARLARLDLAGIRPIDDRYRVTIRGSGPNFVAGLNGMALDGEFAGALPSGDGTQGGDFIAIFEIDSVQATLDSLQAMLFATTCAVSGCHTGPTGPNLPSGMDLSSADASYMSLVNVTSLQDPASLRVVPGDAENSYLVRKLQGTTATGARMPLGGPALAQSTIDAVRACIDGGAAR